MTKEYLAGENCILLLFLSAGLFIRLEAFGGHVSAYREHFDGSPLSVHSALASTPIQTSSVAHALQSIQLVQSNLACNKAQSEQSVLIPEMMRGALAQPCGRASTRFLKK
jgi:hypothetical protein